MTGKGEGLCRVACDNWDALVMFWSAPPFFFQGVRGIMQSVKEDGHMGSFWEIVAANIPTLLCMLAGVALLIAEVFLPGFGVPGISGIALMLISVVLVWTSYGPMAGLVVVVVGLVLAGLAVSVSLRSAAHGKLSKSPLSLPDIHEHRSEEDELAALLGKEGVTATVLRPAGIGEFDGVRLNVVSDGEFIGKGAKVRVEKIEGNRIVVREMKKQRA